MIYGYPYLKSKIKSFVAYHVPKDLSGVEVVSLKQKADVAKNYPFNIICKIQKNCKKHAALY